MNEWFKTSILGIIVLGSVGSLIAVAILKVAVIMTRKVIRPGIHTIWGKIFLLSRSPYYVIEMLKERGDPARVAVTCTMLLFTGIMGVGLALSSQLFFVLGILYPITSLSSFSLFVATIIVSSCGFSLGVFTTRLAYKFIFALYEAYMDDIEKAVEKRVTEEFSKSHL